jgi:hypothetical protein
MTVMHQGDVLFVKVSEKTEPKGKEIKALPDKGLVLQHGEALGHYHRVEPKLTSNLKVYEESETDSIKKMVLHVEKDVEVVHEEHAPITLTPGTWEARTQREHSRGLTRKVID